MLAACGADLSWQLRPCAFADLDRARDAMLGMLSTLCSVEHLCGKTA